MKGNLWNFVTLALTTTGMVLLTIWILNRVPFTKQFVRLALA